MMQRRERTKATVCIVESLDFFDEDTHREGEIISRTLRLSGKPTHYSYVRTREEMVAFARSFGSSDHRYLHVSCHGDETGFATTTGWINAAEFAEILAPHVGKRRVFLSSCLAAENAFARRLLDEQPSCWSVLAPIGEINFDDAAIFWTAFYHLIFKEDPDAMKRHTITQTVEKCAALVGEQFRLFYLNEGKVVAETLG